MRAWRASVVAAILLATAGCGVSQHGCAVHAVAAERHDQCRHVDAFGRTVDRSAAGHNSRHDARDHTRHHADSRWSRASSTSAANHAAATVRRLPDRRVQRHRGLLGSAVSERVRHPTSRLCPASIYAAYPERSDPIPGCGSPVTNYDEIEGQRLLLRRRRLHGLRRRRVDAATRRSTRSGRSRGGAGPRVRSRGAVPRQRVRATDDPERAAGRLLRRGVGGTHRRAARATS